MAGFRGSRTELETRFGLGPRLRMRVGALLAHKVDVSETLLELARAGSAYEALLLAIDPKTDAAGLTTERLAELARGLETPPDLIFVVQAQTDGEWRSVMCEEELIAEAGFEEAAVVPAAELFPVTGPALGAQLQVVSVPEDERLDAEDSAAVRMTLLTGVDPAAKIEALRKLRYAQLADTARAQLLIRALGDEAPAVRAEAARALPDLGFPLELADAIARLATGTEAQRRLAVDHLTRRLPTAGGNERLVIFHVLAGALRSPLDPALRSAIIDGLGNAWEPLDLSDDGIADLVSVMVELLAEDLEGTLIPLRRLTRVVARHRPEALRRAALSMADRTGVVEIRRTLLAMAAETAPPESERAELARRIVDAIDRGADLEPSHNWLEVGLISLGADAVDPLLERLAGETDNDVAIYLVRKLDDLGVHGGLKPAVKNRIYEAFLELFKHAAKHVGVVILEARLAADPQVGQRVRARMASELLDNVHRYRMARILEEMREAMVRIGLPALKPILDLLSSTHNRLQRERASEILGELCLRLSPGEKNLAGARRGLKYCEAAINDREWQDKGQLMVAWGKIASRPDLDEAEVEHVIEQLRERIWRSSDSYRVLEGLGWAAASPLVPHATAVEVTQQLLEILEGKMPQISAAQTHERAEGTVFELGPETTAYTEMIPALLDGLERIFSRQGQRLALCQMILQRLLACWHDVIEYRVMWSPGTVIALGQQLGRLAQAEALTVRQRLDVIRALRVRQDHLPILEILVGYHDVDTSSPALDRELAELADLILEMLADPDYQDPEDLENLLGMLARLIRRPRLGTGVRDTRNRRQQILRALFEGARSELPAVIVMLRTLLDAEVLEEDEASEVRDRLRHWRERGR